MTPSLENWVEVPHFPVYSVSNVGRVRNSDSGRFLTLFMNQSGYVYTSLCQGSTRCNMSVARLVAEAFLPPPPYEAYDTPINLDGDRTHNDATNLMWRPRWFAMQYHSQFKALRGYNVPVQERETLQVYRNAWDAALSNGLIASEVAVKALNGQAVWPTGQKFQLLSISHIIPAQKRGIL